MVLSVQTRAPSHPLDAAGELDTAKQCTHFDQCLNDAPLYWPTLLRRATVATKTTYPTRDIWGQAHASKAEERAPSHSKGAMQRVVPAGTAPRRRRDQEGPSTSNREKQSNAYGRPRTGCQWPLRKSARESQQKERKGPPAMKINPGRDLAKGRAPRNSLPQKKSKRRGRSGSAVERRPTRGAPAEEIRPSTTTSRCKHRQKSRDKVTPSRQCKPN